MFGWEFNSLSIALAVALAAGGCALIMLAQARGWKRRAKTYRQLLCRRREQFSGAVQVFRAAEEVGEFGVWQFCPTSERQSWSKGMRSLFGLDARDEIQKGDAETLLQTNNIDLIAAVTAECPSDEVISSDFKVRGLDGEYRYLTMRARRLQQNEPDSARFVGVFLNVTQQSQREEMLELSRREALDDARKARDEANRDPLTNLHNRRYVMAQLDRMLTTQKRRDDALSLVMFDIDHFKRVNDEYGHLAGDTVLRRIGRIASEQAREGDVIGRIGGEEFVWLINGANQDFARVLSERLRQTVAMRSGVGVVPPVTVSIGFVTAEPGDTSLSLFARADEALYEAKNAGRNTIRMAA